MQVWLTDEGQPLRRLADTDLFEWRGLGERLPLHYRLTWVDIQGCKQSRYDPYSFAPQLSLYDLHLFNEGRYLHAYRIMGAHLRQVDGIDGVLFSVWAPNAERVSVIGDFNNWDGRCHPLHRRDSIWELFMPDVMVGMRYQFEIRGWKQESYCEKAILMDISLNDDQLSRQLLLIMRLMHGVMKFGWRNESV